MKTLFLFLICFSSLVIAQNITKNNFDLFKTKIEYSNKTFFVYEKDENLIFSSFNSKNKKEEILNFCTLFLYLEYCAKVEKEKKKITFQEALKNIENPQLFIEFINLQKSSLILTNIF